MSLIHGCLWLQATSDNCCVVHNIPKETKYKQWKFNMLAQGLSVQNRDKICYVGCKASMKKKLHDILGGYRD